jgi:hypothetical protein
MSRSTSRSKAARCSLPRSPTKAAIVTSCALGFIALTVPSPVARIAFTLPDAVAGAKSA